MPIDEARRSYITAQVDNGLHTFLRSTATYMKKCPEETQTLHADCNKAEPTIFTPPQTPFTRARDGQNIISWRWSLPLPTNPVWRRSVYAISSYCGNRPTYTPTHRQDWLQYTAPQLVHSVKIQIRIAMLICTRAYIHIHNYISLQTVFRSRKNIQECQRENSYKNLWLRQVLVDRIIVDVRL